MLLFINNILVIINLLLLVNFIIQDNLKKKWMVKVIIIK